MPLDLVRLGVLQEVDGGAREGVGGVSDEAVHAVLDPEILQSDRRPDHRYLNRGGAAQTDYYRTQEVLAVHANAALTPKPDCASRS